MPDYTATDPKTGKSVTLTGDSPPTEQELNDIFSKLSASEPPPASDPGIWERLKSAAYQASPLPLFEKQNLPTTAGAVAGAATGGLMAAPVAGATAMLTSAALGGTPEENVTQGVMNAGAELAAPAIAALKPAGARLMQSALKPGVADIVKDVRRGIAIPPVVQTLLDEGINVTHGGLAKLQGLLGQANKAVGDAIAPLTGQIERPVVAAKAYSAAQKMTEQTNPTSDLKALGQAVDEFLNPVIDQGPLSPQQAQKMKVGTYKQIGDKYNTPAALNPAQVQAQMAFARGLKEEIERLATAQGAGNVKALNAREGRLLEALDATAHRVAQAGNTNPVGFAFVTHAPLAFMAALIDKSPVVKSLVARGLYQQAARVAGVAPTLLRSAVASIAQDQESQPQPESGQQ